MTERKRSCRWRLLGGLGLATGISILGIWGSTSYFIGATPLVSSIEEVFGHQRSVEADFRYSARQAYKMVLMESCQRNPAFARSRVLAPEIALLDELEAELAESSAGYQLEIARSDLEASGAGCWSDSDPHFAQRHVEMARKGFAGAYERLVSLAPQLSGPKPHDPLPPETGAAFRKAAGALPLTGSVMCRISEHRDDRWIMGPAWRAVSAFRQSLQGTAYAAHYDLAREDAVLIESVTVVECAAPDRGPPEDMRNAVQRRAESKIADIRRDFDIR